MSDPYRVVPKWHLFDVWRKAKKFTDVVLKVGTKTYECHLTMLAMRSAFFEKHFAAKLKNVQPFEMVLSGFNNESFEEALDFMYSGKITLTHDNYMRVLRIADSLEMKELIDVCEKFLISCGIRIEHLVEICSLLDRLECKDTLIHVEKIAAKVLSDSHNSKYLMKLPLKIFRSVIIHATRTNNADVIVQIITKWASTPDKAAYLDDLLKLIDLRKVSAKLLAELISNGINSNKRTSELDSNKPKKIKLEGSSIKLYLNPKGVLVRGENEKWEFDDIVVRECDMLKTVLIDDRQCFLTYSMNKYPFVEFFVNNKSLKKPPINHIEYYLSALNENVVLYESKISPYRSSVSMYYFELDKWYETRNAPVKSANSGVTSLNNLFYLIGGTSRVAKEQPSSAYVYDKRKPTWVELPKMHRPHVKATACSLNGKVYVFGSNELEMLDPVANKWTYLNANFPSIVEFDQFLVPMGNDLYLISCNGLVSMFDRNASTWRNMEIIASLPPMHKVVDFISN